MLWPSPVLVIALPSSTKLLGAGGSSRCVTGTEMAAHLPWAFPFPHPCALGYEGFPLSPQLLPGGFSLPSLCCRTRFSAKNIVFPPTPSPGACSGGGGAGSGPRLLSWGAAPVLSPFLVPLSVTAEPAPGTGIRSV